MTLGFNCIIVVRGNFIKIKQRVKCGVHVNKSSDYTPRQRTFDSIGCAGNTGTVTEKREFQ